MNWRLLLLAWPLACNDVTSYSNRGDHYEGQIVQGAYIRAGFGADVSMYLTFDGARFQEPSGPGSITTNDGRFRAGALRPIPQEWHDTISLMSFGEGRVKSMIYAVAPARPEEADALAVVSLMKDEAIEVRLIRSAPGRTMPGDEPMFGVFRLERKPGPSP
jgi:hypothetical protein